ncbi:Protein of unknown function [Lactobacillus equicursoris DSM 19284 = JCM 14600 = CIP 110162]|uniref:Uncharacterized protein n=1 Tax=Lactobacillus equicursoris DSM 19284 = JCM 14600 = CIP 110162 TaxID=1293597 RepID=K0NZA6_9LACO|nr:hypothetical protein [Lactobacillus equicursoris]KRL00347.1 hypothetical protein FC20_GL001458 [Lactobacillus equicursoris DSM 19284 = JCM 14600 = CIP 110162]CCK85795.1 Protein of unknown function [Lactobacillus equicursoris DSM 19284 = JCM 14600 = CIP 110162]
MTFNKMLVLLFQPSYGVELYGTKHVLFGSGWLILIFAILLVALMVFLWKLDGGRFYNPFR